jgi:hypothetical protein
MLHYDVQDTAELTCQIQHSAWLQNYTAHRPKAAAMLMHGGPPWHATMLRKTGITCRHWRRWMPRNTHKSVRSSCRKPCGKEWRCCPSLTCSHRHHAWLISELGPARSLTRSGRRHVVGNMLQSLLYDSSRTLQKPNPNVRRDPRFEQVGTTCSSVSSWHGSSARPW